MPIADRNCGFGEQVVFLDGISGTGKTMIGPILSTFKRVETQRFEHIYEYLCALRFLDRIQCDAADAMIKMYLDLACYNSMIGRESNFRWRDLSGVLRNPGGLRYLRRLFLPDGDVVIARIKNESPVLQIVSHQILGIAEPLFAALGRRLTLIEMVRHPLHLIDHWYSWIDGFGVNLRDFTIWVSFQGQSLPWFAHGWEEKFVKSNKMDRVIFSLERLIKLADDQLAHTPSPSSQVVVIPFECFVVNPWPYIEKIEVALGSTSTRATQRELRKQKVPRTLTLDGKDLPIYRRYNWAPLEKDSTEENEMRKRWEKVNQEATAEGLSALEKLCRNYESRYWGRGVFVPSVTSQSRFFSGNK